MSGKERWEVDGGNSELSFSLRHIVVSEIQGRFRSWGGEMTVEPDDVGRAQNQIWIDVASIETGSADRDAHIRSSEFMDVTRFPRAQFTSRDVSIRREGEALITGSLQLHGVTCDVELLVAAQRTWTDARGLAHASYRVRGNVDRQAFGLHWNQDLDIGGIVVGDKVEIDARVELVRAAHAGFARAEPDGASSAPAGPA
jgi:polyisoprenoid-binding protein YceI